jgi:hypothetical protein
MCDCFLFYSLNDSSRPRLECVPFSVLNGRQSWESNLNFSIICMLLSAPLILMFLLQHIDLNFITVQCYGEVNFSHSSLENGDNTFQFAVTLNLKMAVFLFVICILSYSDYQKMKFMHNTKTLLITSKEAGIK